MFCQFSAESEFINEIVCVKHAVVKTVYNSILKVYYSLRKGIFVKRFTIKINSAMCICQY